MKKAIYFRLIILTFIAVLICGGISAMIHALYTQNQTKEWLTKLTLSTAENYRHNTDVLTLSKAAGENRVTLIAPDGTVLADSEADINIMENHAGREEVKFAAAGAVTVVTRKSTTLGERFMYASIIADDGNILRLAHSYSGLFSNLFSFLPAFLTAILTALILSLFLAGRFTRSVTEPLEKMVDDLWAHEYETIQNFKSPYYEIEKIMRALRELLQKITDSNLRLQGEREKVDYILSNMAEGFVLLDDQKNVLLCNNSARAFFSCDPGRSLENIYHLTRNQHVVDAITLALEHGQSSMFDLELKEDLIVNCYVSPSVTEKTNAGATVLIVDMTSQKQLEQQKRDFFSNASHELKTPVTSILGFSEMLGKDIIKDESEKAAIISRIETEAKRLSELISDILTISKLEGSHAGAEYTDVHFTEVVKEAIASILPVNDDTEIEISADLDNIFYRANKRQLFELCVNLIENAVKYNQPNGKVFVSLKTEQQTVVLTVRDTGIGIPPEHQARVFERFFRVDYGRDKKIGGTGLGLSIVKHIVNLYGGTISLQSKKNTGTTVTVSFPM